MSLTRDIVDSGVQQLRQRYIATVMHRIPREVQYCTQCVISNQRPRITFDAAGVCSACRVAEQKREIDWETREAQLKGLLDRHRRNDGSFDVIVPYSGGKDSGMVAHRLKYEYGMHPLTVSVNPLLETEIGKENWKNGLVKLRGDSLGTINAHYDPPQAAYRLMSRLALEVMGDPFLPFIYLVKTFPVQVARLANVGLIMYAEDGEAEYGGMRTVGQPGHHPLEGVVDTYWSGILPQDWQLCGVPDESRRVFEAPPLAAEEAQKIECRFFGYFRKWVPQENYYYAVDHMGFQPDTQRSQGTYSKYASLDDKLDGLHYYLSYCKFGLGRASSDAAHEIRDGHITRDEGVALVQKFDGEWPSRYLEECLEFLGLDAERLSALLSGWRPDHLWMWSYARQGPRLRHPIGGEEDA